MRLAADGKSLRAETDAERVARTAPRTEQENARARLSADPVIRRMVKREARKRGVPPKTVIDEIMAET